MSARWWLRLRDEPSLSWHALQVVTDTGWTTRCGLNARGRAEVTDDISTNARTCERCWQLLGRDAERGVSAGVRAPEDGEVTP